MAIASDYAGCCTSTHRSMGLSPGGSCLCFWEAASAQGGRRAILIICTCSMAIIIAIAIVSTRSIVVIQNQMAASQYIYALLPCCFAFISTGYNEGDCRTTSRPSCRPCFGTG